MKIKLLVVGKALQNYPEDILFDTYKKRLAPYVHFELVTIKPQKGDRVLAVQKEGKKIIEYINPLDCIWLLDEKGKAFTSVAFSKHLQLLSVQTPSFIFVIGGSYGFSEEVYEKFKQRMSLSQMTLPHGLARVFFIEQLYRAFTIMGGHPYHH